ncbi:hypothetical protein Tco_1379773 [Tanacetum coccineum]
MSYILYLYKLILLLQQSCLHLTYTFISSDSDLPPWGFHLISDAEPQSLEAVLQSLEQALPSPDYVSGPEYPGYLASSDDEISIEDQPLSVDASPTALSPGYVADSDPLEEDPEEDPKEDPADYPADEGYDEKEEEESSEDDDNDDEEEASEEDDDDEEEHLAPADSAALPAIDFVPSVEETEPFETDKSAATPPPPPCAVVPLSMTRLHRARITVKPQIPLSASIKARIVEYVSAPSSLSPSPLTSYSSPLHQIPSPPPLIPSLPLPIPSPPLFEVRESSTAAAARQIGHTLACRVNYGFIDTLDASIRAYEGRGMTTVDEVNERVTDLAATQRQGAHELYVHHEDAQDDRALLRAQISLLTIEMRYFRFMSLSYEREAVYARQAWSRSEDMSTTLEALIKAQEARITTLKAQIRALHKDVSVLQKQRINDEDKLTMHIQHEHDKYRELEHTRDAER